MAQHVNSVIDGTFHLNSLASCALPAIEGTAVGVRLFLLRVRVVRKICTGRIPFPEVSILVVAPLPQNVRTIGVTILTSCHFGSNAVLIWPVGTGSMQEQGHDDHRVSISACKVEGRGAGWTRDGQR
jgi:hypothetical protein